MKKLGLIGGTGPESTMVYYREINKRINEKSGGTEFPDISIESLNLTRALSYIENDQYGKLAEYVRDAMHNLVKSGAGVIALTAATMHINYAIEKGYRKVGLLGTIFTMEKD